MGWFKSLFGMSESRSVSPEVDAIFEKLHHLMTDENAQNDRLPEPYRSEVVEGSSCDEITGAVGEFGRDFRNPIPVNGPFGQLIYLSNLFTASSEHLIFHRLGSLEKVDAYETVSFDGNVWDVLFLDLYHPRKSRRAPAGYRIAMAGERQPLFFGTNEFAAGFPRHVAEAIRDTNERMIGLPMRPGQIREALDRSSFSRPAEHKKRVGKVMDILDIKEM